MESMPITTETTTATPEPQGPAALERARIEREFGDMLKHTPPNFTRPKEHGISLVDRVKQRLQSFRQQETPLAQDAAEETPAEQAQAPQEAAADAALETGEVREQNPGLVRKVIQAFRARNQRNSQRTEGDDLVMVAQGNQQEQILQLTASQEAPVEASRTQQPSRFVQALLDAEAEGRRLREQLNLPDAQPVQTTNRAAQPANAEDPYRFIPKGRHLNANFVEMAYQGIDQGLLLRVEGPATPAGANIGEALENREAEAEAPQNVLRREPVNPRNITPQENPAPVVVPMSRADLVRSGEILESANEIARLENSEEFKKAFPKLVNPEGKLFPSAKDIIDEIIHPEAVRKERNADGQLVEVYVLSPRQRNFVTKLMGEGSKLGPRSAEREAIRLRDWINQNPASTEEEKVPAEADARQRAHMIFDAPAEKPVETPEQKKEATFRIAQKINDLEEIKAFRREFPELLDKDGSLNTTGKVLVSLFLDRAEAVQERGTQYRINPEYRAQVMEKLTSMREGLSNEEARKVARLLQWIERDTTNRPTNQERKNKQPAAPQQQPARSTGGRINDLKEEIPAPQPEIARETDKSPDIVVQDPNGVGGPISITDSTYGNVVTGTVTKTEVVNNPKNVVRELTAAELAELGLAPDGTPLENIVLTPDQLGEQEDLEISNQTLGNVVVGEVNNNEAPLGDRSEKNGRNRKKRNRRS